jgi:type IV pilus assembly protein PilO
VPELLDAITQEARSTGVELIRLRPQASQSGDFYSRQMWEVAVLGEYHDVGRYLGRVGSLPRIIKPYGVSITPAPTSRATRDLDAPVEVSLGIETYVLGALAAAEPAEG